MYLIDITGRTMYRMEELYKMRTIDLCSGIGGIRRGFELAGDFENVLSAEIDKYACQTYEHLFGDDARNDVTNDEFRKLVCRTDYDVLLAGFPCQPFSKIGLREGFKDITKGTIFFHIARIIEQTMPKAIFLENVENLVSHDEGRTFRIIINTLENELNYHVIGVKRKTDGTLSYDKSSFIRNTRNFGLPQNRPRVYIVSFSRNYFGEHLKLIPERTPEKSEKVIFKSVRDILDVDVSERFFLSSGLLKTLEEHKARQKRNGNGFGCRIANATEIECPIASTILATGGSGKERNLSYDPINGKKYAGMDVKGKKSPINEKYIRTMTPAEWGRLQGFIGYAFLDENGNEGFSFPENMSNQQKFKQFGNSVSIPLIEEMALFIKKCIVVMTAAFSEDEKRRYEIPGPQLKMCLELQETLKENLRPQTIEKCCRIVSELGVSNEFCAQDISNILGVSQMTAYNFLHRLKQAGCIRREKRGYELENKKNHFAVNV